MGYSERQGYVRLNFDLSPISEECCAMLDNTVDIYVTSSIWLPLGRQDEASSDKEQARSQTGRYVFPFHSVYVVQCFPCAALSPSQWAPG